ncbi:MAG: hypothetical protein BWX54_01844 [Verrucomicrobia bacterium ADurb.Bin018]|nr:MAG: hypothetical protein BWX54_01844 [Verrucomicrobia bacterium ADurb.Bin018]
MATERTAASASATLRAPCTVTVTNFCAPSPSRTISMARRKVTPSSAATKAGQSGWPGLRSALPAQPLASSRTVSLVLWSPSTEIRLKERSTAAFNARCSARRSTWASVSRNASMVAMQGWIMPAPLAMPVNRQARPFTLNGTVKRLGRVSVVMMPAAAASPPVGARDCASFSMPGTMRSMRSGTPMRPVEHTRKCLAGIRNCLAAWAAMASASRSPCLPVQALA